MAPLTVDIIITRLNNLVLTPLITLIFGLAFVYFLYGVFTYMRGAESDEERTKGGQHILWGAVGMFIMVSVYGIMRLILTTFGISYS